MAGYDRLFPRGRRLVALQRGSPIRVISDGARKGGRMTAMPVGTFAVSVIQLSTSGTGPARTSRFALCGDRSAAPRHHGASAPPVITGR